ncbi:MAG TPA: Gfo/Idh/MocA family oxidoreductase, partial [Myxococcota bacterium]|nr:Gfo/Idh/MocA family oxidoreductase [Myxococcota bacterium]
TNASAIQASLAPPDKQPVTLEVPRPPKKTIGYAVVGLGELALAEVMPAFAQSKLSRPVALVSGHRDKALRVAQTYGIAESAIYDYASYDKLAQNDEVEAIYIILPNSMHAEYTIRGLKAGKHVLCEKPMAVSVAEGERMVAAAKDAKKKLMIAYRLHYEPYNRKVMEMCATRELGAIKTFSSSHCMQVKAPNIRLSKPLGGGPVGDIGIYSIQAARYVTREEPTAVTAMAYSSPGDQRFREVPESVAFTMLFPSGTMAHCDCSFAAGASRRYRVHCADGFIDLDPAFSYRGLRLSVARKDAAGSESRTSIELESGNQFALELDHFAQAILDDSAVRTPGEEGLKDMRVIAAIDEAVKTGKTVRLKA